MSKFIHPSRWGGKYRIVKITYNNGATAVQAEKISIHGVWNKTGLFVSTERVGMKEAIASLVQTLDDMYGKEVKSEEVLAYDDGTVTERGQS